MTTYQVTNYLDVDLSTFASPSQIEINTTSPATWYVAADKLLGYGVNTTSAVVDLPYSSGVHLYLTGKAPSWWGDRPWLGDYTFASSYTASIGSPAAAVPEVQPSLMLAIGLCVVAFVGRRMRGVQ